MSSFLLLTGKPGSGKTSLIKQAIASTGLKSGGFYTEEIRTGPSREGFRIVTLDGRQAVLAHVGLTSPHRVGRYKVDTAGLNEIGVSAMRRAIRDSDLIVIDEIGKMELLSPQFREVLTQAVNSGRRLLGTIMLNRHPFSDEIKRHPAVETVLVTSETRDRVMNEVLAWLAERADDD